MAQMGNVHREQVEQVMSEFVDIVGDQTSLGVGSDDYVRKMLTERCRTAGFFAMVRDSSFSHEGTAHRPSLDWWIDEPH
jgi:hypothetical protein